VVSAAALAWPTEEALQEMRASDPPMQYASVASTSLMRAVGARVLLRQPADGESQSSAAFSRVSPTFSPRILI
jgi:hypothetical protein